MAGLHTDDDAPAVSAQLDLNGDEFELPGRQFGGALRGVRAASQAGATAPDTIALGDTSETRAAEHLDDGSPDARRTDSQLNGHPSGETELAPYTQRNDRTAVVVSPISPPERPRQGFTGADPTRVAWQRRPVFLRWFDKLIADHPIGIVKVEMPSPIASRPREYNDLVGGYPSAMGSTGTGRAGVGPQLNTVRRVPTAWDATLVQQQQASTAVANARGRTFR